MAGVFAGPLSAAPVAAPVAAPAPQVAAVCVACHGMHGEGAASGVPRLAGQNADYMSHALSTFRDGTRASAVMQPIARTLDDAQSRRLADYFSRQDAPGADAASTSPQLALAGKRLAEAGTPNVAACFSCHGPQGKGDGARFPRIASQPAQFIIDRLHRFQERARENAPVPGTMTEVSTTLDERQIKAAAAYLSHLQP